MAQFKHRFLTPGTYHVGGGKYATYTRDDLAQMRDTFHAMKGAGLAIPLLFEHALPGSDEGSPRDKRAADVKHGAGWVDTIEQDEDGGLVEVLDVTDPEAHKLLREGSVKFTSPEIRPAWLDGKGREWRNVISHSALTHKPRNPDQSAFEELQPALQFSLADRIEDGLMAKNAKLKAHQFADDEDKFPAKDADAKGEEKPADDGADKTTPNPDMPTDPKGETQFRAVIEQLKAVCGIDLAQDTDESNFVEHLLTALKTTAAVQTKMEEELAPDKEGSPDSPMQEEVPPMQFSLADATAGKTPNPLLAKVIKMQHNTLLSAIRTSCSRGHIGPALRDALLAKATAVQFSAEADEQPALTLSEVVGLIDKTTPEMWARDESVQLSSDTDGAVIEEHPSGNEFYGGEELSEEESQRQVDALLGNRKKQ